MTTVDPLELRAWRYGSYRVSGHRPEVNDPDAAAPFCVAIGPGNQFCGRRVNFVEINWLVPRTPGDPRSPGHWRHNPRPYGRAGRA